MFCRQGSRREVLNGRIREPRGKVSLVAQLVRNKTSVQYLGREDPLEKRMATHSSILAWRIKEFYTTEGLSLSFLFRGEARCPLAQMEGRGLG